jgi:hypothetical protein
MKNLMTCLAVGALSGATFATTWTVDVNGKADFDRIQDAVDAASTGDEIIVMPGTYAEEGIWPEYGIIISNKDIYLHSSDGPATTIIDGENTRRCMMFYEGVTSATTVEGFTFQNGYGAGSIGMGGAMYVYLASPNITNCIFQNNYSPGLGDAGGGGAVSMRYCWEPTIFTNCAFKGNVSETVGGALSSRFFSSAASLLDCTFCENEPDTSIINGPWNDLGGNEFLESCVTTVTTWTVDDDGKADFNNLQAALDDVLVVDGDEILVMPGIYTSTATYEVVDMRNKAVWMHSSDGPEVTFIDGESLRRGIHVTGSVEGMVIEGFTIQNCYGHTSGGGMWLDNGAQPTLINCSFTDNIANENGGGMFNNSSSPTLDNCTFTGNTASGNLETEGGGGMYNINSNPTLTNSTFTNNTSGYGGGMFNDSSSPTVTDCTFENNTATVDGGGGMLNNNSSSTIENTTFTGNSGYNGGALRNDYCSPMLTNCLFMENTASGSGAGMWNHYSSPTFINCIFENNTAAGKGGVMCSVASELTLTNCMLKYNVSSDGGGLRNIDESGITCTAALTDTTVCGNLPDQIVGTWIDNGGNFINEFCGSDCNGNGIYDNEDIANGTSLDCNGNGVPDECDIADGSSPDMNPSDGVPDECQGLPLGGCCFGSQCVLTTAVSCSISGGAYQGDGNGCGSNPCGEPNTGACCIAASCLSATTEDCFNANGSFAGELVSCNDVVCQTVCVGDLNSDGDVNVTDILMLIAAWGACP